MKSPSRLAYEAGLEYEQGILELVRNLYPAKIKGKVILKGKQPSEDIEIDILIESQPEIAIEVKYRTRGHIHVHENRIGYSPIGHYEGQLDFTDQMKEYLKKYSVAILVTNTLVLPSSPCQLIHKGRNCFVCNDEDLENVLNKTKKILIEEAISSFIKNIY